MIQVIRIDDRLLHGQVAWSWKAKLGFNAIVIVSDDAANDSMRKQIMKMCCPEGVKLAVRTVEDASSLLMNPRLEPMNVFVVCPDPGTVKRLLERIPDRPIVNLGGMAAGEEKVQFSRMVFVGEADLAVLDDLDAEGVEIEVQEVPSTAVQPYGHLRKKFQMNRGGE